MLRRVISKFLLEHVALYLFTILFYALFRGTLVLPLRRSLLIYRLGQRHVIQISYKTSIYARDLIDFFTWYKLAVVPKSTKYGLYFVDYSRPGLHLTSDFSYFPLWYPTIAENPTYMNQYLDLLSIKNDDVILDIGAYSGYTTIRFAMTCTAGEVYAFEPDLINFELLLRNLELAKLFKQSNPDFRMAPVSAHKFAMSDADGHVDFMQEGSTGSFAISSTTAQINRFEKHANRVKVVSRCLSSVSRELKLSKIDIIKMDIEGSESQVLADNEFFDLFQPKIILEPLNGLEESKIVKLMLGYGYSIRRFRQHGARVPLLLCTPPNNP